MSLLLRDREGKVLRVFRKTEKVSEISLVQNRKTGRLSLYPSQVLKDDQFRVLWFGRVQDIRKQGGLPVGPLHELIWVEKEEAEGAIDHDWNGDPSEEKRQRTILATSFALFFVLFLILYQVSPREFSASKVEQFKEKIDEIRANIPKPKKVTQVKLRPVLQITSPEKPTSQNVNIRRMGALSALGELQKGAKTPGLDLNAATKSAGPGLGGEQGSGGTQTSIYARGMVSAPLGMGSNLEGAGGVGTKGKGGGQAGYGQLQLTGSLGAQALPAGADAKASAGLDREQIEAVVVKNASQIRFCYELGLQQNASLAGRVSVNFTIGGNGLVKSATISSSTLGHQEVEQCILNRLKSWKFPIPEGGVDVQVQYPFTLRRTGQG